MNIRYSNGKERNGNFMNIQIFGTKNAATQEKQNVFSKSAALSISLLI